MHYDEGMYLTDGQYRELLEKVWDEVSTPGFKAECVDCTVPGSKHTLSNCGLCNVEFTERGTALFPDQFPEIRDMKYRRDNHRCPFDTRERAFSFGFGCFYGCYLFRCARPEDRDLDLMKQMVRELLVKWGLI